MNKYCKNALYGIQESSLLSELFFSDKNMKMIQNSLRKQVYNMSNEKYLISEQNSDNLFIIMRSIYLQYSRYTNDPKLITKEIENLNKIVISTILPELYSNVQQYMYYLNDIDKPYQVMEHPKNVDITGSKSYDLSKFY